MRDITPSKGKRLTALEEVIAAGKEGWRAAGEALIEIRDKELYRAADYDSFWAYCSSKWGWQKRNVGYLLSAVTTLKALPEGLQNFASSASAVREAAKAPESKRAEVIEVASSKAQAEEREVTAADVKVARTQVCEPEPEVIDRPRVIATAQITDEIMVNVENLKVLLDQFAQGGVDVETIAEVRAEMHKLDNMLKRLV